MNLLIPFDHLLNLFFSSTAVPPDGSHNYINRCELLSLHIFASNYCPHSFFPLPRYRLSAHLSLFVVVGQRDDIKFLLRNDSSKVPAKLSKTTTDIIRDDEEDGIAYDGRRRKQDETIKKYFLKFYTIIFPRSAPLVVRFVLHDSLIKLRFTLTDYVANARVSESETSADIKFR